jgi:hypothetical protein
MPHRRLRVLTWHVHGNYLYYLTQTPHEWYVLSRPGRLPGYAGTRGALPFGANVHELPVERLRDTPLDCILFQSAKHYLEDRYEILSPAQQRLPKIFLEHDPPQQHPTNTLHVANSREVLLVHVTHFNALMWDNGDAPVRVIEHGVVVPEGVRHTGEIERGIVVVNHLKRRGRRLGYDVFQEVCGKIPLDLVGMDAEAAEGLGEIRNLELPGFMAGYRFFFNPIRYTSLGLAVVEAMSIGMPVLGLATTEMSRVIENRVSGYVDTDVHTLIEVMRELLAKPRLAREWGEAARHSARERFGIERFVRDWEAALSQVAG